MAAKNTIIQVLVKVSCLRYSESDQPFQLYTNASNYVVGAALMQKEEWHERSLCFINCKLTNAKIHYSTHEYKLLAAVFTYKKLRHYVYRCYFTLYTDNGVLKFLFNKLDLNSHLSNWIIMLTEFQFTAKHILGKDNIVADTLSYYHLVAPVEAVDIALPNNNYEAEYCEVL